MGQLSSLVAWDQVLSLSGNPLEGLVQMVNSYAQVRGADLCCQALQAAGQHVAGVCWPQQPPPGQSATDG